MLLENQIALVTGATSGIGKAIAKEFLDQGAHVILVGTNQAKGEGVIKEFSEQGLNKAEFFSVDVSNYQAVHELIDQLLSLHQKIDILVNCAGITRDSLLMKLSEEDWDLVIDTNIKSCYNMCHAVIRSMMKARRGKIINISSIVGLIGNAGQTNYSASKAAMIGFSKALAKEGAARNILVNVIAPGWVETPMTDVLSEQQGQALLSQVPLGRKAQPEEIAKAALFLASSWSSYITGEVITVAGGLGM